MPSRVIFLDRDGTLNVDRGFVHRVEDWEFTYRAPEALRDLRAAGYTIALVSNQSGIGRGYFTREDVDRLHAHVQRCLADHSVRLDALAICPHVPEAACACRKPGTGLARQIEGQLPDPVDYRASWVIGDKVSDVQFGKALGTRTALLSSPYWCQDELEDQPDVVAESLYAATQAIIKYSSA